jgi:hypothetical protein
MNRVHDLNIKFTIRFLRQLLKNIEDNYKSYGNGLRLRSLYLKKAVSPIVVVNT